MASSGGGGGHSGRILAHQLSNGLYVSGGPEAYKNKHSQTMSSTAMPYTGGDIKKSGELGKMFEDQAKLRHSGTFKKSSNSGPLLMNRQQSHNNRSGENVAAKSATKNSGPISGAPPVVSRTNSGNLLPATGLITSGPLPSSKKVTSGPLDPSGAPVKPPSMANVNVNANVTAMTKTEEYAFKRGCPKAVVWIVIPVFVIGFIAGTFIVVTVHNAVLLVVVGALCLLVCMVLIWNAFWGKRALLDFVSSQPDADLRNARQGQYVKVTGVVTCGSVPLETSFRRYNRCIYASARLFEYRGWSNKPAQTGHRLFSWGLRYCERHVADFYISDLQSGLRALVKAGNGARVTPCVEEELVADGDPSDSKGLHKDLSRWLAERSLSTDGRPMRLKEGYIKEGSTVTVMGVVQKQENVLMIVPPPERVSTGCQWSKLLLPGAIEGLLIACNESSKFDGIPL